MRAARFFPFLETLRTYTTRDFRADFMAALTVTPMAIPQAMAYALIAGVHPQYGIYACMLPVIVAGVRPAIWPPDPPTPSPWCFFPPWPR